jgi:hypothetical protein
MIHWWSAWILSNLPTCKKLTAVIGADIKMSISIRPANPQGCLFGKQEDEWDIDPIIDLIGPYDNSHKSKPELCNRILNMMRELNLRAAITFFDKNWKYNTWLAPPPKTQIKKKTSLPNWLHLNPKTSALSHNKCKTQIWRST